MLCVACCYEQAGDALPDVTLNEKDFDHKVSITDIFKGKKGVLFGVPGAFTPLCSKTHLPGARTSQGLTQRSSTSSGELNRDDVTQVSVGQSGVCELSLSRGLKMHIDVINDVLECSAAEATTVESVVLIMKLLSLFFCILATGLRGCCSDGQSCVCALICMCTSLCCIAGI